jgi:hypothetical protein
MKSYPWQARETPKKAATWTKFVFSPLRAESRHVSSCELSGGCPFGADLGDWSYHTSVIQDRSE